MNFLTRKIGEYLHEEMDILQVFKDQLETIYLAKEMTVYT